MSAESSYLRWAIAHQGKLPYDLSISGTRSVAASTFLGSEPLALDDATSPLRARERIAALLGCPADEILLTAGAAHAIFLGCATALRPGDSVVVEHPSYEPLREAAQVLGAEVRSFDVLCEAPHEDFAHRALAAVDDTTRLVLVSNLHNPTGHRRSDAALRSLASQLAERKIALLVDEIYAPFDDLPYETGLSSAHRLGDDVLAISSLTKTLGLGLHRIGWLAARRERIARAEAIALATIGFLPFSHGEIANRALDALPDLAARARIGIAEKRGLVAATLGRVKDLSYSAPSSGLFGFAWFADGRDVEPALANAAADGVLVSPGRFFGVPSGLRVSWSGARDDVRKGIEILAHHLEALRA